MRVVDPAKIERFLDEFFVDFNGSRAVARTIGLDYDQLSKKEREKISSLAGQYLRKNRDEIDRRLAEWRAQHRMTVEQFGDQLLDATRVDPLDFFDEEGRLTSLADIPPHLRRQIASFEVEEFRNPEGEVVSRVVKVKFWDRRKAEEMWGKWQKMFTDKVELSGKIDQNVNLSIITGD